MGLMMTPDTWLSIHRHETGDRHGCNIETAHIPRKRSYSNATTAGTRDKKAVCGLLWFTL